LRWRPLGAGTFASAVGCRAGVSLETRSRENALRALRMRITWKDVVATVLVAAILVPYIGYLARGDMPFVRDPGGIAAAGLILGVAAAALTGRALLALGVLHRVTLVIGAVTFGLGVAAVMVGSSEALLAAFMAGIVVTWALAELIHTGSLERTVRARQVPHHR